MMLVGSDEPAVRGAPRSRLRGENLSILLGSVDILLPEPMYLFVGSNEFTIVDFLLADGAKAESTDFW